MATRSHPRKHSPLYEEKRNSRNEVYYQPYTLGRPLGKGGFAQVFEVHSPQSFSPLALKLVPKADRQGRQDPLYAEKIKGEIRLMEMASRACPNVVRYLHSFSDKDNFYILMELCGLGCLNDILKRRRVLSEPEVRYYVRQMAVALVDLMKQNIIHRDIKLANFFVTADQQLRLGDFGLATLDSIEFRAKRSLCGTPNYIAPEVIEKKEYSFPIDAWALGVSTFTLLIGVPPFETKTCKDTYERIKKCSYTFEGPHRHPRISEQAKSFIKELLVYDPSQRLTPQQILTHPFLVSYPMPLFLEPQWAVSPPPQHFIKKYSTRLGKKLPLSNNDTILEKKDPHSRPLYRFVKEEASVKVEVKEEWKGQAKEEWVKLQDRVKEEPVKCETSKLQTSVSLQKRDVSWREPSPTVRKRFRANFEEMGGDQDVQPTPTMKSFLDHSKEAVSVPFVLEDKRLVLQINRRRFSSKLKSTSLKEKRKETKQAQQPNQSSDGHVGAFEVGPRGLTYRLNNKLNEFFLSKDQVPQSEGLSQENRPNNRKSDKQPSSGMQQRKRLQAARAGATEPTQLESPVTAFAQLGQGALFCWRDGSYQLHWEEGCNVVVHPNKQQLIYFRGQSTHKVSIPMNGSTNTLGQMHPNIAQAAALVKNLTRFSVQFKGGQKQKPQKIMIRDAHGAREVGSGDKELGTDAV